MEERGGEVIKLSDSDGMILNFIVKSTMLQHTMLSYPKGPFILP